MSACTACECKDTFQEDRKIKHAPGDISVVTTTTTTNTLSHPNPIQSIYIPKQIFVSAILNQFHLVSSSLRVVKNKGNIIRRENERCLATSDLALGNGTDPCDEEVETDDDGADGVEGLAVIGQSLGSKAVAEDNGEDLWKDY